MNGFEFRHSQLADRNLSAIPVIVYTAADDTEYLRYLTAANAYLPKPSAFPTLLSLIRQHCLK